MMIMDEQFSYLQYCNIFCGSIALCVVGVSICCLSSVARKVLCCKQEKLNFLPEDCYHHFPHWGRHADVMVHIRPVPACLGVCRALVHIYILPAYPIFRQSAVPKLLSGTVLDPSSSLTRTRTTRLETRRSSSSRVRLNASLFESSTVASRVC